MKLCLMISLFLVIGIVFNIVSYDSFLLLLAIVWYIASVMIMYSSFKYSIKYKARQFNIKRIVRAIKGSGNGKIKPLESLCVSLAAKIGVGSLSGVALSLYFGGIGSIFWLMVISLLVSINTYRECILGIRYRDKIDNGYVGGPSYYIKKCLGNKYLSKLYGLLVIMAYSFLFLSIQTNTIVNSLYYLNIDKGIIGIVLLLVTFLIIRKGLDGISKVNSILVPVMLIFYVVLGGYVFINHYQDMGRIFGRMIQEAFSFRSILTSFLVGMQRAIFITESSIGTSAISASSCDNDPDKQGMLEVMGIHVVTFLICLTTFLIIITTDYESVNFGNINGIEIVMYAFKCHFGSKGMINLSLITVMFAFSTIISSYFFGVSNLRIFSQKNIVKKIFMIIFLLVIIISCYIKPSILWNLCDYLVAFLAIINVYAINKIKEDR